MKKIILIVLLASIGSLSYSQDDRLDSWIDSLVSLINQQVAEKNYTDAVNNADLLLQVYSGKEAHLLKAMAVMEGKNFFQNDKQVFGAAEFHLKKAIELDSTYNLAYGRLGILYITFQEFEKAIISYTNFINYSTDSTDLFNGYTDRGTAKSFMADTDGAINDYYKAIEFNATHFSIFQNLGAFLTNAERYDEAEKILTDGLKLYPTDDGILNNLGFIMLLQEKFQQAIGYFNQTLEVSPNNFIAYGNRGFCSLQLGKINEAEADFITSGKINAENPYLYKYWGQFYIVKGDTTKACEMFVKANQLNFTGIYGNEVNDLLQENCMNGMTHQLGQ